MKQLNKAYWLLAAVTLPQVGLFIVFGQIYRRIHSLLEPAAISHWLVLGGIAAFLCSAFTFYGLWALVKKVEIHPFTGYLIFGTYLPWLYLVFYHLFTLIPRATPSRLFFGVEPQVLLLTMTIPVFVYGLLLLVFNSLQSGIYKPTLDLLLTLIIPACWYIGLRVVLPLIRFSSSVVLSHCLLVLFVITTVIFFFFFARLFCGLLARWPTFFHRLSLPVLLLLPTVCLLINNKHKIFGDFSEWPFYVLAVCTGILLVLPPLNKQKYRWGTFVAKSFTLPFSAYFFLVFMPYLPLAIIAIVYFGLGALLLVPLVFGFVHAKSLWEDWRFLKQYSHPYLSLIFTVSLLLLPGFVGVFFYSDKQVIQTALDYVYHSEYTLNAEPEINLKRLRRVIRQIRADKDDGRALFGDGEAKPYLSSFYKWIVLDNLTLSQGKLSTLEKIFFLTRTSLLLQELSPGKKRLSLGL